MSSTGVEHANKAMQKLQAYIRRAENDFALYGENELKKLRDEVRAAADRLEGTSLPQHHTAERDLKAADDMRKQVREAEAKAALLHTQFVTHRDQVFALRRKATIRKTAAREAAKEAEITAANAEAQALHAQADEIDATVRLYSKQHYEAVETANQLAKKEAAMRKKAVKKMGDALLPTLTAARCRLAVARCNSNTAISTCASTQELVATGRAVIAARNRLDGLVSQNDDVQSQVQSQVEVAPEVAAEA